MFHKQYCCKKKCQLIQKFKRKKMRWKEKGRNKQLQLCCCWRSLLQRTTTASSLHETLINEPTTTNNLQSVHKFNNEHIADTHTTMTAQYNFGEIVFMYFELRGPLIHHEQQQKQQQQPASCQRHRSIGQMFWLLICCCTLTCLPCDAFTSTAAASSNKTTTTLIQLPEQMPIQIIDATGMQQQQQIKEQLSTMQVESNSLHDYIDDLDKYKNKNERFRKKRKYLPRFSSKSSVKQFHSKNPHRYNTNLHLINNRHRNQTLAAANAAANWTKKSEVNIKLEGQKPIPIRIFDDKKADSDESRVTYQSNPNNLHININDNDNHSKSFSQSNDYQYDSIIANESTKDGQSGMNVNDYNKLYAVNFSKYRRAANEGTDNQTSVDNLKLINLVMEGLSLTKLPDMSKINISQQEYATKYREYLDILLARRWQSEDDDDHDNLAKKIHKRSESSFEKNDQREPPLHMLSILSKMKHLRPDGISPQASPSRKKTNAPSNKRCKRHLFSKDHSIQNADNVRSKDNDGTFDSVIDNIGSKSAHHHRHHQQFKSHRRSGGGVLNNFSKRSSDGKSHDSRSIVPLHFTLHPAPVNVDGELHADDVEEANVRLLIVHSPALALKHKMQQHAGDSTEFNSRRNRHRPRHMCAITADDLNSLNGTISSENEPNPRNNRLVSGCNNKNNASNSSSRVRARRPSLLHLKLYQRLNNGRRLLLDARKVQVTNGHDTKNRELKKIGAQREDYNYFNSDRKQQQNNEEFDEVNDNDDYLMQTQSQWLQFDATSAVRTWLRIPQHNLGLELSCDSCWRLGARILSESGMSDTWDDDSVAEYDNAGFNDTLSSSQSQENDKLMPVLNIIGKFGITRWLSARKMRGVFPATDITDTATNVTSSNQMNVDHAHHHHQHRHHNYNKNNMCTRSVEQRCCRHRMDVVFKELKGFEFIIQPKVFDAGYCYGRCPPRYNPAHHHAMLQSLIWKQNRHRAPRPCCAPSKLVELEVLHVDEKDSEKLKISTWTDMRVVDCACS